MLANESLNPGVNPRRASGVFILVLLLLVSTNVYSEPIDTATYVEVLTVALKVGVPLSVAVQLHIEESGDYKTGTWGNAKAKSRLVNGYRSRGLFQIYEEPNNLLFLVNTFWYAMGETDAFDIEHPIHNATVALRYLKYLHGKYGSWYRALCYYNCGSIKNVPGSTQEYAKRIIRAR